MHFIGRRTRTLCSKSHGIQGVFETIVLIPLNVSRRLRTDFAPSAATVVCFRPNCFPARINTHNSVQTPFFFWRRRSQTTTSIGLSRLSEASNRAPQIFLRRLEEVYYIRSMRSVYSFRIDISFIEIASIFTSRIVAFFRHWFVVALWRIRVTWPR